MPEGFPPVSIAKDDRLEYFKALETYSSLRSWWQGLWTSRWSGTLSFPNHGRRGISPPHYSKTINRRKRF